jgi:hypothetical protein
MSFRFRTTVGGDEIGISLEIGEIPAFLLRKKRDPVVDAPRRAGKTLLS